jgi:hypothetical protein
MLVEVEAEKRQDTKAFLSVGFLPAKRRRVTWHCLTHSNNTIGYIQVHECRPCSSILSEFRMERKTVHLMGIYMWFFFLFCFVKGKKAHDTAKQAV